MNAKLLAARLEDFHLLVIAFAQLTKAAVNRDIGLFVWTPLNKGFAWKELPEMDSEILIQSVQDIEHRKSNVNVFVYPNYTDDEIRNYYSGFEFDSTSYRNRCLSLWMTAYILLDGAVRPYHSIIFSPGNVIQVSFSEIWNNKRYRSYRHLIKNLIRFPVCAEGFTELYRC